MQRKVDVVEDLNGNKIVMIHDIQFMGRQAIEWSNAKAKANATQGIPELIEIATNKAHKDNYKEKHTKDAKYGWYRFESRFALPVFGEDGEVERYNVFRVIIIVRHAEDGKLYLYDIMNIKKKRVPISSHKTLLSQKLASS